MDWDNKDGFFHNVKPKIEKEKVDPTAWTIPLQWSETIAMLIWEIEKESPSKYGRLSDTLFSLKQAQKYLEEMESYPKGFVSRYGKKKK